MGGHSFKFIDDGREYHIEIQTFRVQRPGYPAEYRTKIYRMVAERVSNDIFTPPVKED